MECPTGELVFSTRSGLPYQQANIHRQVWTPLLHKCGLTNDGGEYRYNFHMLRQAAASHFIAYLKWPPKRIQTVMGHANVALTFDLYGHLFEDPAADRDTNATFRQIHQQKQ